MRLLSSAATTLSNALCNSSLNITRAPLKLPYHRAAQYCQDLNGRLPSEDEALDVAFYYARALGDHRAHTWINATTTVEMFSQGYRHYCAIIYTAGNCTQPNRMSATYSVRSPATLPAWVFWAPSTSARCP